MSAHDQSNQASDFLDAYGSSSALLKAWLGAYSVGVPAFLFMHEKVLGRLLAQGRATCVAELFASAIALQVLITLINKYIGWGVYSRHSPPPRLNWYTNLCETMSEWIWMDVIADLATIALLTWGSVLVFASLVAK
jgi:hypothetical protein